MAIDTPVKNNDIADPQLPQVRRAISLGSIPKITPAKALPGFKKQEETVKSEKHIVNIVIAILILGILFFGVAVIYKYDKIYKTLKKSYLLLKDQYSVLQNELKTTNTKLAEIDTAKDKLSTELNSLNLKYSDLGTRYKTLQLRFDNNRYGYRNMLSAKSGKINMLEGDKRVFNSRIEAANAQNELLSKQLVEKNKSVTELTNKLITNIDEQVVLVSEYTKLKADNEKLMQELNILRPNESSLPAEGNNADE